MSADVQQQSAAAARPVFKMNPDFWQQARGPPTMPPGPNLGQPPNGGGGGGNGNGGGGGNGGGNVTPSTATGGPTPPGPGSGPICLNNTPNNTGVNNNQNQPPGGGNGSGGGSSTPPDSKMMMTTTEKIVNEIQIQNHTSRSNSAINDRTLEECWSTLQRVSWHLFRCV
ncbi:hypothetical protein L9F63_018205 [Diploptera punctata]|uniref:Uncharacterized protein n=1 Tax=Diploptera punctata TaxID=6984 RepID=A0AAD7ZWW5_DIPPU|nr:hypothetical protein L9F63_018205 [Diploptera punctata]